MKNIITIENLKYPKMLRKISSPPEEIYYRGNWDASIFENCLAVVGSRKMTSYGKQITTKLVSEVANAGITIVSGFMYGIDATAHKAAVDVGGRTIAVMPCGINVIHPQYQNNLYNKILENSGLIVSEFKNNHPPALWTYPRRNRIVAGLSKATLVIEAGQKSGSLITANLARKYGRKLFVIPGPLTSKNSQGIMQLIKKGAFVVADSKDILEVYNLESLNSAGAPLNLPALNKLEQVILKELQREPMKVDGLSRIAQRSVAEIGTTVSIMQLKGLLAEEDGKYHINNGGRNVS